MGKNHRTEKVAILTDTGSSISPIEGARMGIWVLPLQIIEGLTSYSDLVDIKTDQIYRKINKEIELKTSMPSYGTIHNTLMEIKALDYDKVICIPLTPGISSTADSIRSAAEEINLPVLFVDTYTTCQIQNIAVHEAMKMVEQGFEAEEIVDKIQHQIEKSCSFVLAKDINHLKRGGRLTPLAASMANMLKIVPLLIMGPTTEGKIDVLTKVRTERKAMKLLVEEAIQFTKDGQYEFIVLHSDYQEGADELKEALINHGVLKENIKIAELNSVIAVHVGMQCLAIQCIKKLEIEGEENGND